MTKTRTKSISEAEHSPEHLSVTIGSPEQPYPPSFVVGSPGTASLPRDSKRQWIDFILCIGDDRLDEPMFEYFRSDEGHTRTTSGTESIVSHQMELSPNDGHLTPIEEMNTGLGNIINTIY